MSHDANMAVATKHGWHATVVAKDSTTLTHTKHQGQRIVIMSDGDGWQRYDNNDMLVGHSRYGTKLEDHLARD